jgi:hypothetical protein
MVKIITWVDLQGRYRTTTPSYASLERELGLDEEQAIAFAWSKIVGAETLDPSGNFVSKYGIADSHQRFLVEEADQGAKVATCCGNYFRYGVFMRPDKDGGKKSTGELLLSRDARDGAWEMDTDGTPKINMSKARGVHMDCIRACRNKELVKLDLTSLRAVEAGDTSAQSAVATEKQMLRDIPQTFDLTTDTPEQLKALWPSELPARE